VPKSLITSLFVVSFFGGIPLGEPKKENKGDKKRCAS